LGVRGVARGRGMRVVEELVVVVVGVGRGRRILWKMDSE
jgi:hypothetical protein